MAITAAHVARSPRIRLGMVGGGRGAFIGAVHRIASRIDDQYELVAGAFSSDPDRSAASAADLGVGELAGAEDASALGHERQPQARDALGREAVDALPGKDDAAATRRREAKNGAHRGGLAHAVAAQQRRDLALAHLEVDAKEHLARAVAGLQSVHLQQRAHAANSSPR